MSRNLAEQVLAACRVRAWTIVTAESCTGGLVAAALTDIAGSSDVFERGYVTYSYAAKTADLGVPSAMLARHGAVSREVALSMADGALAASGADMAIAITGVAGPGASDAKPEGLVWFALALRGGKIAATCREFGPLGRDNVRRKSVRQALDLMLNATGQSVTAQN